MSPKESYTEGRCYSLLVLLDRDAPFAMQKLMTLAVTSSGWRGMLRKQEDMVLEKKPKQNEKDRFACPVCQFQMLRQMGILTTSFGAAKQKCALCESLASSRVVSHHTMPGKMCGILICVIRTRETHCTLHSRLHFILITPGNIHTRKNIRFVKPEGPNIDP